MLSALAFMPIQFRGCSESRKSSQCVSSFVTQQTAANGSPNSTFNVRHVWIASSLKLCCRPRLQVGAGIQAISGSNQIDNDPRCFKLSL
jgi:hypothetical protein